VTEPFDRTAWTRRTLRQLVAAGVPINDASMSVKWILDNAPEDANLDTWLPTPAQMDAAAVITDADIMDARADWYNRRDNAGRWQFILDAVAEEPSP